jgi:hypothetical protein
MVRRFGTQIAHVAREIGFLGREHMAQRWWMKIFGPMFVLSLLVVGSAWALPTHEYDMG